MLVRTEAFRSAAAALEAGSTGFIVASAGTNVNDGTGTAWTNPGNITTDDNVRANCNRTTNGNSQFLYGTFDLSTVPDGATITGVEVRINRGYSSTAEPQQVRDLELSLTKDGSAVVGDNKGATSTDWPTAEASATYGASDDLWGTTLTAAEVKAATFGVMLEVDFVITGGASTNARVDWISINIHYEA